MKILNVLKEVKDNRKKSGRRYPLHSLLSLLLLSRLCGYKDIKSAWHLSRSLHYKQLHQLGFKKHYRPSYPVLLDALQQSDITSLEHQLARVIRSVSECDKSLAMDGKRSCGRKTAHGNAYHLLSLFSDGLSGVYGQIRSQIGGGELCAAMSLLGSVDIDGKVITGDAMFASHRVCKKVVDEGGDYVFNLKSNRQELYSEAVNVFRFNPWPEVERCYTEAIDKDHGRIRALPIFRVTFE